MKLSPSRWISRKPPEPDAPANPDEHATEVSPSGAGDRHTGSSPTGSSPTDASPTGPSLTESAGPPPSPALADPAPSETTPPPTPPSTADPVDPVPAPADPVSTLAAAENPADPETPADPHPRRLPAVLLSLAVLLTAAGVWCTVEANSAASTASAANRALTDRQATAEATSAVSLGLNKIFSYAYDKTDVTEKAAEAVLRDRARDSYQKLFAQVRQLAPEQKLVLSSRVSATSVQQLSADRAQLLVFLDQSAVRGNSDHPETAAAQLSVTAQRIDGNWYITDLVPR